MHYYFLELGLLLDFLEGDGLSVLVLAEFVLEHVDLFLQFDNFVLLFLLKAVIVVFLTDTNVEILRRIQV